MILPSVSKYLLELVAGPNLLCLRISVFPTATTAALSVVVPPKFALCASVEKAVRPSVRSHLWRRAASCFEPAEIV